MGYLPASRLVLHVVCGADLGPDVLQVGHGRCGQRRPGTLERARGLGRGTHHGHLLHLVDLGLGPGGLGGSGAALATVGVCWTRGRSEGSEPGDRQRKRELGRVKKEKNKEAEEHTGLEGGQV